MRKRTILGTMAANSKRKATYNATKAVHELLWGEKPKKGKKKD